MHGGIKRFFLEQTGEVIIIAKSHLLGDLLQGDAVGNQDFRFVELFVDGVRDDRLSRFPFKNSGNERFGKVGRFGYVLHAKIFGQMGMDIVFNSVYERGMRASLDVDGELFDDAIQQQFQTIYVGKKLRTDLVASVQKKGNFVGDSLFYVGGQGNFFSFFGVKIKTYVIGDGVFFSRAKTALRQIDNIPRTHGEFLIIHDVF